MSHQTTETFSSCSHSPLSAVWQTPGWLSSSFYSGVAPSTHSAIKARLAECCRDSFPTGRLSHFCRRTLQWVAIEFLVTCLTKRASPCLFTHFGQMAYCRKSLGGFRPLQFHNNGVYFAPGNFKYESIFYTLPRDRASKQFPGLRQVPWTFFFFFNLTYIVKSGTLCRHIIHIAICPLSLSCNGL